MTILSYVSSEADLSVGYVYKWTNLVNGKMYIGSHNGGRKDYITGGKALRLAIKKYGIENFQREILYVGPQFREVETEMLVTINVQASPNFYNMVNFYSLGTTGYKNSPEHIEKSASAIRGRKDSDETRLKKSIARTGMIFSESHKANLTKANHKRWESAEYRARISAANTGKTKSDAEKDKIRETMHLKLHVVQGVLPRKICKWCIQQEGNPIGAIWEHAKYQYAEMKDAWDLYVESEYNRALEECAGVLTNKLGQSKGIDGYSLFTGPWTRAQKFASDELKAYWAHNPRLTAAEFEQQWFDGVGQLT